MLTEILISEQSHQIRVSSTALDLFSSSQLGRVFLKLEDNNLYDITNITRALESHSKSRSDYGTFLIGL